MLADILEDKKSLLTDNLHMELRGQKSRSRGVSMLGGNITSNSRSESSGICARVYKNGIYGFASTAEYDGKSAEEVVNAALQNAEFLGSRVNKGKGKFQTFKKEIILPEHDINDPAQKVYIDYLKDIDAYIAARYPDLASRTLVAKEDSMEKILKTSDGCDSHTILGRSYVYLFLDALTGDGKPIELFRAIGGENTFDVNFPDPSLLYPEIDNLYEKLMKKREGVFAEAGRKTVILSGAMTGMLAHEAVGHTVEADLVLGGSVAAHSLGREVASPLVNLTDFAYEAFGERTPLPVYVDDEGIKAKDAEIIKDGILTGYMNSRETAEHFGMEPKGNARAWAYSDEPLIRMRNTAIHPGSDKLADMIASIDDGYYLVGSNNGQADTTGEFMFGVTEGYEIKNGKLGRAILDTTISGVAFEMLKTVSMVSDEMYWESSGFCGKKQPMPVGLGGPALKCEVNIGGR